MPISNNILMKVFTVFKGLLYLFVFLLCTSSAFAFQTGKIAGEVKDESGDPLIGVSVYIEGTTKGINSDVDGRYNINNVDAGTYVVIFQYLGYATYRVENVEVFVDQTTRIDATLKESVIEGEEVVVTAERPIVEKDRTTTTAYISSDQLEDLPVVNLSDAINNQAGVVDGHFRGGRTGEVAYLVNGVPINNAYNNSAAFTVEQNMVSSLQVISGVFNAEYGQALSGVVDIVTKGVPEDWSGNFLAYTGNIVSNRELEFVSRETGPGPFLASDDFVSEKVTYTEAAPFLENRDVQVSIGGPIIDEKLGVRVSLRYLKDPGHLIGKDLFRPSDQSFGLSNSERNDWLIESTGSGDYVSMNYQDRYSLNSSVVYEVNSRFKVDYNLFLQKSDGQGYNHGFKYNPKGVNEYHNLSQNHILGMKYVFGQKSFANLSFSYLNDTGGSWLHTPPEDSLNLSSAYVPVEQNSQQGREAFAVGGNELFSTRDIVQTSGVVGSFTSQLNSVVSIKTGFSGRFHNLDVNTFGITVLNDEPRVNDSPYDTYRLDVSPYEAAAYAQTKIEYPNLIVNAGLRADYFNPNFVVPRDWTQASRATITDPENPTETISNRVDADDTFQLSPRLGIAFPISETGVMRFSAGLFFQTPQLSILYSNSEFEKNPTASPAQFGNANLDPERTLSFEVGLQQGITETLGLDFTIYSKDIRNLTGVEFGRAFDGQNISRFINLDYGTIKGATLSLYQRGDGPISWTLDYTLQFAKGSASNPTDAFNRFQSGLEPTIKLRRLDWDRRNVLNNTFTYRTNVGLTISAISSLQTGTPYTTLRRDRTSFIDNNEDKPVWFNTDMRLYYKPVKLSQDVQFFLQIDNLFDTRAQWSVFNDTGVSYESERLADIQRGNSIPGGLNSFEEFIYNESMEGPPRTVKAGLRYTF
jgi:outer membrane receptor protein involved in Fe transport